MTHHRTLFKSSLLQRLSRGSLTVEAALIAPLLFFAVFSVLYLSFHLHNRACLYEAAAEQAISGHVQEDPSCFGMQSVSRGGSESSALRTVSYSSGTWHFSGHQLYAIEEKADYQIVKPVKVVRTVCAAKKALQK